MSSVDFCMCRLFSVGVDLFADCCWSCIGVSSQAAHRPTEFVFSRTSGWIVQRKRNETLKFDVASLVYLMRKL